MSAEEQGACRDSVCREDDETDSFIRKATSSGRPFGSEPFIDILGFRLNQLLNRESPAAHGSKMGSVHNLFDNPSGCHDFLIPDCEHIIICYI